MPWTAPKTYIAGAILTAAEKNTYERDNMIMLRGGGFALAGQQANDLMRASGADQWTRIAPVNNAALVSNGSGVPAMSTTLPDAVQDNITRLGTVTTGTIPAANLSGTIATAVQDAITRVGTLAAGSVPAARLTAGTAIGAYTFTGELRTSDALAVSVYVYDVGGLATGNLAVTGVNLFRGTPTVSQGVHPLYTLAGNGSYAIGRIIVLCNDMPSGTDELQIHHSNSNAQAGAPFLLTAGGILALGYGDAAMFVLLNLNVGYRWVQIKG